MKLTKTKKDCNRDTIWDLLMMIYMLTLVVFGFLGAVQVLFTDSAFSKLIWIGLATVLFLPIYSFCRDKNPYRVSKKIRGISSQGLHDQDDPNK